MICTCVHVSVVVAYIRGWLCVLVPPQLESVVKNRTCWIDLNRPKTTLKKEILNKVVSECFEKIFPPPSRCCFPSELPANRLAVVVWDITFTKKKR